VSETISADDPTAREHAAGVLQDGRLVVAPTDTTYGLLADAFQLDATQRVFDVRRADRRHPLSVLVRNPRQLGGLVKEQTEAAQRLMAAFWPGALTLVFRSNEALAWDLGDAQGAVAIRMPDEPFLYDLVADVGPLACTAAVTAGAAPPSTVEDARASLADRVALYIDGGERSGKPSTIVDVTRDPVDVLRVGAVAADDVLAVASGAVDWGDPTGEDEPARGQPGADDPDEEQAS
jgi:L-threonylcarbamoyladenylate synthase